MPALQSYLTPIRVHLDKLLLDPNNPRFADLDENIEPVPEARFAEAAVQRETFDRMKSAKFDVKELRDTIRTMGFLPMDRIVVRRWRSGAQTDPERFVVVEGNRRVTALKWLIELDERARETLTPEQKENFTNLEVLLLDDTAAPGPAKMVLPGLRHVSGIKEWGPYQKARLVFELRETGGTPQEVAQSLGLSTREANKLWRSYLALKQMREDEEFGEKAVANKYSYFEEIFKQPDVKEYLGWDDNLRKFTHLERVREVYGWISGEGDDGDRSPKLPEAKSIRDLGTIVRDSNAMAILRAPGGTLERALARFEVDHPTDWMPNISAAQSVLASLSPDKLRGMTDQEQAALSALHTRIEQVLRDREALIQAEANARTNN